MRALFLTLVVFLPAAAGAADTPAATPATPPAAASTPAAVNPVTPPATPAPLRDAEEARSRELGQRLTVGKAVELTVGDRKVLALHMEQQAAKPRGALLLLHDLGGHADWPGVVAALRQQLPAQGWETLSVQLPIPAPQAVTQQQLLFLDGAAPRIDAALAWLKARNAGEVVVVGHGFGANAALEYAVKNPQAFKGMVLAGLPHYRSGEARLATAPLLEQISLPVLDLFGDADRYEVVATAAERRQAARRNPGYSQLVLPRGDHFLSGQEPFLVKRVQGWLARHLNPVTTTADSSQQEQP